MNAKNAKLLTTGAVAAILGLTPQGVRNLIKGGVLAASRPGKHYRVAEGEAQRYRDSVKVKRSKS